MTDVAIIVVAGLVSFAATSLALERRTLLERCWRRYVRYLFADNKDFWR